MQEKISNRQKFQWWYWLLVNILPLKKKSLSNLELTKILFAYFFLLKKCKDNFWQIEYLCLMWTTYILNIIQRLFSSSLRITLEVLAIIMIKWQWCYIAIAISHWPITFIVSIATTDQSLISYKTEDFWLRVRRFICHIQTNNALLW